MSNRGHSPLFPAHGLICTIWLNIMFLVYVQKVHDAVRHSRIEHCSIMGVSMIPQICCFFFPPVALRCRLSMNLYKVPSVMRAVPQTLLLWVGSGSSERRRDSLQGRQIDWGCALQGFLSDHPPVYKILFCINQHGCRSGEVLGNTLEHGDGHHCKEFYLRFGHACFAAIR